MKKLLNILLIFFTGCIPPTHAWWTTYTVPAGKHYSLPRATVPVPANLVRWEFKTNDTWEWEQPNTGLSKVGGIFWGSPHKTSVRVGYECRDEEELWYYIWENGTSPQEDVRLKGKICRIEIPKNYEVTTGWSDGHFVVELADTLIRIQTDWTPKFPAAFTANYIGGTYTIGHKWKVPIKLR